MAQMWEGRSPIPAQMWRGEPDSGADVAGGAQSWCRCGGGSPPLHHMFADLLVLEPRVIQRRQTVRALHGRRVRSTLHRVLGVPLTRITLGGVLRVLFAEENSEYPFRSTRSTLQHPPSVSTPRSMLNACDRRDPLPRCRCTRSCSCPPPSTHPSTHVHTHDRAATRHHGVTSIILGAWDRS